MPPRIRVNPHWYVATERGVLAAEEVLQMLLDHVQSKQADEV